MSAIVQAKSSVLSGRYAIYGEIAAGGMASILYGRLVGPVGFARPVAIKRLHPHIARDPSVVSMFIDEARICARVSHANVVPILDVIQEPGELALVMEYVHGVTLDTLLDLIRQRGELMPLNIAGALMLGVLHGLEAAHEARSEQGEPLQIVHRDVSPQNIILGVDGLPRLFDFGIAKARGRVRSTPSGELKGKLAYMAPEQLSAGPTDARVDIYAATVVLWEVLTGRMLFDGAHDSSVVHAVLHGEVEGPKALRADVSDALDALVLRGLSRDPELRFLSVREMARTLERALVPASQSEVSEWLNAFAGELLRARAEWLREMQRAAEEGSSFGAQTKRLPQETDAQKRAHAESARTPSEPGQQLNSFLRRKPRSWLALVALGVLLLALTIALWPEPDTATQADSATKKADPEKPGAARNDDTTRTKPTSPAPTSEDWASEPEPRVLEAQPPEANEASPLEVAPEAAPRVDARGTAREPNQEPRRSRREQEHEPRALVPRPKAADCREPYVIDALGVKHWKRECL